MDVHNKAMDSMFDDFDDMESRKMFHPEPDGDEGGVSVTITVSPNGAPVEMNKGGEMMMADGGMVEPPEDNTLPPFLRKKKKGA